MKTIIYKVFIGNKWTSTLIIFSILTVLMIFWTIAEAGPWALDLTEPTELILRILFPIVFSILYLVYRFARDGRLTPSTSVLENGNVTVVEKTQKSALGLTIQVVILSIIAALAAFVLYHSWLFLLFPIPRVLIIMSMVLGIPTIVFWLYKSVSFIKHAHTNGENLSTSKILLLVLLAFLAFYFTLNTYGYISYKIYDREKAVREAQQLAEVVVRNQQLARTYEINQPTVTVEKTVFYSSMSGDVPMNECHEITSDPLHQDEVFKSAMSFYCEEQQWTAYPALFYRFLYETGGTYKSPTLGNTGFKFTVPENWFIDEELVLPQNEDGEWLRIGVYSVDNGKVTLSGIGTKVFYRATPAKDFEEFSKEINNRIPDGNETIGRAVKTPRKAGNFDTISVIYEIPNNLDNPNDVYVFLEPGKYLLFQRASDFIMNSLERN